MAQITVEILDFLATATKEMKQSATSKSDLRLRFHDADIVSEKLLKRVIGQTNLEDGLKKLDKLTSEGVAIASAIASAQHLRVTHDVNKKVTGIEADGKQRLFSESSASSLSRRQIRHADGIQQTVDGVVDDMKRS